MSLSRNNSIKDLGVIFDKQLSFGDHIACKVSEAMRSFGFIVRNCKNFNNIDALKTLYYCYVRSKLEYSSLIWYPIYNCHKHSIEQVQRKFLKYLWLKMDGEYPVRGMDYSILTDRFGVDSLDVRRKVNSIRFLYGLLHDTIDCSTLLAQINFNIPRLETRQNFPFYCKTAKTNILLRSPVSVMCSNFNSMSHLCDINNSTCSNICDVVLNCLRLSVE